MKFFGMRTNSEKTRKMRKIARKIADSEIFPADTMRCGRQSPDADALHCGRGLFATSTHDSVVEWFYCSLNYSSIWPLCVCVGVSKLFICCIVESLPDVSSFCDPQKISDVPSHVRYFGQHLCSCVRRTSIWSSRRRWVHLHGLVPSRVVLW